MSWASQQQIFNSFRSRDSVHKQADNENVVLYDLSRNNLQPVRTFGRDISNLQSTSAFMKERMLTNAKATKKIKLKYPKNSVSRRQFGFEVTRQTNPSSIRGGGVTAKRYTSSSSLTDRNK
jgi:hypothetical protein